MTEASAVAVAILQTDPHLRLTWLAKLLGRDISALGKAAQRITNDIDARRLVSELVDACGNGKDNLFDILDSMREIECITRQL